MCPFGHVAVAMSVSEIWVWHAGHDSASPRLATDAWLPEDAPACTFSARDSASASRSGGVPGSIACTTIRRTKGTSDAVVFEVNVVVRLSVQ